MIPEQELGFKQLSNGRQQWIVVLTDGEDNSSTCTLDGLREALRGSALTGLIVVGVGEEV